MSPLGKSHVPQLTVKSQLGFGGQQSEPDPPPEPDPSEHSADDTDCSCATARSGPSPGSSRPTAHEAQSSNPIHQHLFMVSHFSWLRIVRMALMRIALV
jgi:hypothetical protein